MWIVAAAWLYVTVMMAVAEATSPQGTILGAVITLVFYGILPLALVLYLMGTPARRKAMRAAEAEAQARAQAGMGAAQTPPALHKADLEGSAQTDGSGLPARDAVAPERKEP